MATNSLFFLTLFYIGNGCLHLSWPLHNGNLGGHESTYPILKIEVRWLSSKWGKLRYFNFPLCTGRNLISYSMNDPVCRKSTVGHEAREVVIIAGPWPRESIVSLAMYRTESADLDLKPPWHCPAAGQMTSVSQLCHQPFSQEWSGTTVRDCSANGRRCSWSSTETPFGGIIFRGQSPSTIIR